MPEELKRVAKDNGIAVLGIADITLINESIHPELQEAVSGLTRAISIGIRLSDRIMESLVDRPTKLYFHHYRTNNALLDQTALKLTAILQSRGFAAVPIPASQIVDWANTTSAHISHRKIAQLAGHGWLGRSGLLVHPQYGARLRFATIFTNANLPAHQIYVGGCGECTLCIPACPAGAISENGVDIQKCFMQLKIFAKQFGGSQYICGLCIKACPGNRKK